MCRPGVRPLTRWYVRAEAGGFSGYFAFDDRATSGACGTTAGQTPPQRGLRYTLHVGALGVQEPQEPGQPPSHGLGEVLVSGQRLVLQPQAEDPQRPVRAVQLRVEAGHDRVAPQDGQHVVAVLAFGRGRVDLPAVVEPEQLLGPTTDRVER